MAPVPNGTYTITRPPEQLLTMLEGAPEPKTPVVLLPPTGNPGEQEWQLEKLSNGNYTIRNLRSETYLSYDGDPETNKPVVGYPEPREWALYQSEEPHTFRVVVPGGPVDGMGIWRGLDSPDLEMRTVRTPLSRVASVLSLSMTPDRLAR
ncbi:hypothetical protein GCM10010425_22910 [Streptomyces spororaveus]